MTAISKPNQDSTELPRPIGRRLLIVSVVRLLRDGLVPMLEQRPNVHRVLAVANSEAALLALSHFEPTLILLDVSSQDGLLAGRRIADAAHGVQILGFAGPTKGHDVLAYARAGFTGFVPCDASMDDLFDAIERAGRGELLCSATVAATLFRQLAALARKTRAEPALDQLTGRQREIVRLIDSGLSNKEIARHLSIEVSTVKNHVHNLLEKLNVRRRGEAAARVRVVDTPAVGP